MSIQPYFCHFFENTGRLVCDLNLEIGQVNGNDLVGGEQFVFTSENRDNRA